MLVVMSKRTQKCFLIWWPRELYSKLYLCFLVVSMQLIEQMEIMAFTFGLALPVFHSFIHTKIGVSTAVKDV